MSWFKNLFKTKKQKQKEAERAMLLERSRLAYLDEIERKRKEASKKTAPKSKAPTAKKPSTATAKKSTPKTK